MNKEALGYSRDPNPYKRPEIPPIIPKAYEVACYVHKDQKRAEGIAYISHCMAVEKIIYEEWEIKDPELRAAGLLHDTIEDTEDPSINTFFIQNEFGPTVAFLVDGVSHFRSEKENGINKIENDAETIKKILNIHPLDPRVTVLKLADRLHNMRTLNFMPQVKQGPKAWETTNIYVPLAESLGMWNVKKELEDLALMYTDPEAYKKFSRKLATDKRLTPDFIGKMKSELENELIKYGIRGKIEIRINSRARLKEKAGHIMFQDINDVISFRVIIDDKEYEEETLGEVYRTAGILRQKYHLEEDPKRYDDFIAEKRSNDYSAIQITLQKPQGATEIAVTSRSREEFNNWGIISLMRKGITDLKNHSLKIVITSRGLAKWTTKDATGIDIAYLLNPDYGLQEKGMLIDGIKHKISDTVPNGANVDLILGKIRSRPRPGLENYAQLESTKKIIEKQKLQAEKERLSKKGERIILEDIKKRGILELEDLYNNPIYFPEQAKSLNRLLNKLGCDGQLSELYYQIANGLSIEYLNNELDSHGITKKDMGFTSIMIQGTDEPGILQSITSGINNLGNINIRFTEGGVAGRGTFKQKVIIEKNLSKDEKTKLEKILQTNSRITKICVV